MVRTCCPDIARMIILTSNGGQRFLREQLTKGRTITATRARGNGTYRSPRTQASPVRLAVDLGALGERLRSISSSGMRPRPGSRRMRVDR
jgi:hypothetical protein